MVNIDLTKMTRCIRSEIQKNHGILDHTKLVIEQIFGFHDKEKKKREYAKLKGNHKTF